MNSKILGVRGFQKHGIKDDKWTIKDKVHQYKEVLKLYDREKKLKATEAEKKEKLIDKELRMISSEVKEYRGIFNEVKCGDKRRMRTILQGHRDLQLAYENHDPGVVYDAIYQDCNLRRKQLDVFYCVKRSKMKEFFDLKRESTLILNTLDDQNRLREPDRHQQKVAAMHQRIIANTSAAETIRTTYQTMLNILEKDTIYFNAIINELRGDRIEQCKVLMKTTYVGQLAAEDLDDTRERYKKMSIEVLKNMKERERTLKIVRTQVDNLWCDIKSLVRIESDTKFIGKNKIKKSIDEKEFEQQIKSLEDIFERAKDALQVRSYDELLSRFEEQARQRTRLMGQFKASLGERDIFLNKKNNAELILADLKHSMITTSGQYKTDKKEISDRIEEEKKREYDFIELKKSRGELLINIKSSLQNLLAIMVCVKPGWSSSKKSGKDIKKVREKRKKIEMINDKRRQHLLARNSDTNEKYELEKIDPDARIMLEEVMKKSAILLGLSNFEMSPENEMKARSLYQNYVAEYRKNYHCNKSVYETRLSVDHEVVDPTVLTRADLKAQSKHIVEAHSKFE